VSDSKQAPAVADVRMNVKVSRRDYPLLTEEIARLPKGPRRTSRLAHLATLGLCWERAIGTGASAPSVVPPVVKGAADTAAALTYRGRLDAGQLASLLADDWS
jgi:hypothetical protein